MKAGGFNGVRCYLQSFESNEIGKTLSDDELLSRFVCQPDAFVFGIILRRHGPMIYAVCRRTLRDAHDVEDAFQATFLVFVRKAASIRRREVLGSWLYGVAHRVAVRLRNEISRRSIVEGSDQEAIASAQGRELSGPKLNPILDEELRRLPVSSSCFAICKARLIGRPQCNSAGPWVPSRDVWRGPAGCCGNGSRHEGCPWLSRASSRVLTKRSSGSKFQVRWCEPQTLQFANSLQGMKPMDLPAQFFWPME